MLPSSEAQLERLRIAVLTGRLPRDLGEWLLECLERQIPRHRRIAERDRLLREAAALVPGSTRRKARELRRALLSVLTIRHECPGLTLSRLGVHGLVSAALEADPDLPRSERHLRRLIEV